MCQIVFVNNADDASGNFQFHPADGRVWSQRKTFKEVVGIPIRYFDASIAFVSCNLGPGDHDMYRPVAEKHAVATSLIHSFGMDTDRAAVDFPNLYHHTFLSGNLNYDVELPRPNLLNAMDQAFKAECLSRATDLAIESKFKPSLNNNAQRHSIDRSAGHNERGSSPTTIAPEALNANVAVEWNLLYFKSRNSLGRSSNVSASSDDLTGGSTEDDVVYEEVYTSCDDELPFTLLQSPLNVAELKQQIQQPSLNSSMLSNSSHSGDLRKTSVSENEAVIAAKEVKIKISDGIQEGSDETQEGNDGRDAGEYEEKGSSWLSFLDGLFPTQAGTSPSQTSAANSFVSTRRSTVSGRTNSVGSGASGGNARSEAKKLNDLMSKSQLVADNSERKWKDLLRFDELRAALEAKEVFCGFEEPPISFLPSYPRKVGTSASFSTLTDRTCRGVFLEVDSETSTSGNFSSPPAYKDRVLAHSLQDTKQRLHNVKYWLCEEITTSTHKPVCSVYELEIDRFFSYKLDEAALTDFQTGKHALREKTGVQEFKVKLVNLDANIWTIEANEAGMSSLQSSGHHPFRGRKAHYASPGTNRPTSATSASRGNDSASSSQTSDSMHSSQHHQRSSSQLKKKRSVANLVDRVLRKDRSRSSTAVSSSKASTPNPYSDFSSDAQGSHPQALAGDRLSTLTPFHLELVPVEPVSISTVFPLPSEDLYALQRKVYEVAHSVQNGFQSSARDEQAEESLLAFTNYRTVAWKEAGVQGVVHTAITKAVNGVVHIAVTIQAEKGHGGQGVLCIQESDLLTHATPVFSDARPIPFDVTLTWGGKHVGYLHGDILSSL